MSMRSNYNLNDQIYENADKTIRIYKSRKHSTVRYIAVKSYQKKYHPNRYDYEYKLINLIKHPNLVSIESSSDDGNYYHMEMEYCPTGDLSRCLWQNKNNRYNERVIKLIGSQLLKGLQAMHKSGVIHCNLKPSNILIDEYGNMKICDFKKSLKVALMNKAEIKKNKTAMTPCYTAPELFQEDGMYSFKTDLWALGCIMFELAVGQVPFFDENIGKLITKIINEDVNLNRQELSNYSDEFVEVLRRLLDKDSNSRATWGEVENFSFWEGALRGDSNSNKHLSSNNSVKGQIKDAKGIDVMRLSRIAMKNITEKKEGYSTETNVNEIGNADQEFDFEDKEDFLDLDTPSNSNNNTPSNIKANNEAIAKNHPLEVSVLNISKAFKKDKRTYHDIKKDLMISNEDDMPKLEAFFIHQSDRIIKPIIGNKSIEDNAVTTYFRNKLPFTPWKIDVIKEMINSSKDIKAVENYLYNIYSIFDQYAAKEEYDLLLNLLKYFETIVFDRELANNLINTSFITQLISFLKVINNEQIKIRCCCIIGYLIRYATIIEVPLDQYDFCDIICKIITDDSSIEISKKATATLGEYLFYVATQEETPENSNWKISNKYLSTLLFCLDLQRNEIVKFYTVKTIENILILTSVSKTYFGQDSSFITKILDIYKTTKNNELKQSAISAISHLIKHQPKLIKVFLDKYSLLSEPSLFEKENETIQQSLINCILYAAVGDSSNLQIILHKSDKFIEVLLKALEMCNNVIKIKSILLLGYFLMNPGLIVKYGAEAFMKIQRYRKENNREVHVSVKFFEKMTITNCDFFSKSFMSLILKKDKREEEVLTYTKAFVIIGSYHKISTKLFTPNFLNSIIQYTMTNSKNDSVSGVNKLLYEILLMFSENPLSVENNIDIILSGLLSNILRLAMDTKGDNKSLCLTICANILSILLDDEKLYSSTVLHEGKTEKINSLINSLIPIAHSLLKDEEITEPTLSLLSMIIERNNGFISTYIKEGIIDFVFKAMNHSPYTTNLNIIKILIKLAESNLITFEEIKKMNLIDKTNFLIENITEDDSIYTDYAMELFFDIMFKLNEYRKDNLKKIDKDSYMKLFLCHIEKIAKNFKLCIRLLGSENNFNLQEKACYSLIFLLQLFPDTVVESLKLNLKFTSEDIPNLLKGLELSCAKIHKKMVRIFGWIIVYQQDADALLKPYISYITTYMENICNTTADPTLIQNVQRFLAEDLNRIKKK